MNRERPFLVGNKVKITGNHPWAGHKGVIVEATPPIQNKEKVKLENGNTCFASPFNLQRIR